MSRARGRQRAARRVAIPRLHRDPHVLYEAAVQSPEDDVDFVTRVFRRHRGRPPRRLREDFCGTAALSCEFVRRHAENRAWSVDRHAPTLAWGKKHHLARLGAAAARVRLLAADVRTVRTPPVDVLCAFNFSYWIFHARADLAAYLRCCRAALAPDGMLFLDVYGGEEAMSAGEERRRVSGMSAPDGSRLRPFTYVWEQAAFNVVDHRTRCHIHFELADGTRLSRVFRYDWRLWTVPELTDLAHECGFPHTEVYLEGWQEDGDQPDGIFRRRRRAENQAGWIGYVVARR